jgi:hypothetical protein
MFIYVGINEDSMIVAFVMSFISICHLSVLCNDQLS